MKNILLSGSSGFIGGNFFSKYRKNFFFYLLIRNSLKNKKKYKSLNCKNINVIFFDSNYSLRKKIKNISVDIFVNFATKYNKLNSFEENYAMLKSNVLFPSCVFAALNKKKLKKVITIGSIMENYKQKKNPENFYAATKLALECLVNFQKKVNQNINFYNLKFYDTYGENDKRKKILFFLKKAYKNNKSINIIKNLNMNFLHVDDISKAIYLIIQKNFLSGEYFIKSKKDTNILKLINQFNKKSKKKIRVSLKDIKFQNNYFDKIKKLPQWKQSRFIEKDFKNLI